MRIGTVEISYPVALGPMAGVTDLPFRRLCREMGCGLLYTEMVSAKALSYHNKNTEPILETEDGEHPLAVLNMPASKHRSSGQMILSIREKSFAAF